MYQDLNRLQSVFLAALQTTDPDHRASLLERECKGDQELRRWVGEMLRRSEQDDLAVDTPVLQSLSTQHENGTRDVRTIDDQIAPGTLIAERYCIGMQLGQGGMGSVYRAEQVLPVRRTVAIKLIRPGGHTGSMLARFEAEWQTLARMEHPNIARLFDAGTIASDNRKFIRPYFVMEFIDGIPITKHCRGHALSIQQRLHLFVAVCLAIEHAHQKGVIHRDLKPSNILVTCRDGQTVPMVIDFGIAKNMEPDFGYAIDETGTGMFLGSLDYMAPEQVERGSADVDTRSDVYALGTILYELLCEQLPFEPERLRRASVFDLASILLEEIPRRPSERVNDPKAASLLRGDLDWIVMKCLEKDRNRRYQSSRSVAEDLMRFLHHEPVSAGPPTVKYRVQKFMRRHRGPVVAASFVILGLIGSIAATTYGMVRAWQAEAQALTALEKEGQARKAEERFRKRADAEAANAKAISQFFQVDVIRQVNTEWQLQSEYAPDNNLSVRTALDRAAATIESRFRDQPALEAQIRRSIGYAYDGLGEYSSAAKHLSRALAISEQHWGPDHEFTIRAQYELGNIFLHSGRADEGIAILQSSLEWRRAHLGPDSDETLRVETDLGLTYCALGRLDEAEKLLTHVYDRVHNTGPANATRSVYNLTLLNIKQGKYQEAINKFESLKSYYPEGQDLDPPVKLRVLAQLGRLYLRTRQLDNAVTSLESARECASQLFPEDHPHRVQVTMTLAHAYWAAGRTDDAGQILEESRERLLHKHGARHARVLESSTELAIWAAENKDVDRALSLLSEVDAALMNASSLYATTQAAAMSARARCLFLSNRAGEAEPLLRQALELFAPRLSQDSRTHETRVLLGLVLIDQVRFADAEGELIRGYESLNNADARLPYTARCKLHEALVGLVRCADALNRPENAAKWREELKNSQK